MQAEFEKHSSTNQCQLDSQEKKKYAKLTAQIKQLFLRKIVFENLSIKQASQMLRINYSSAKAIASLHKKEKMTRVRKGISKKTAKVCCFRIIQDTEERLGVQQILSSVGGLIVSEQHIPKRKMISKIYSNSKQCLVPLREEQQLMTGF